MNADAARQRRSTDHWLVKVRAQFVVAVVSALVGWLLNSLTVVGKLDTMGAKTDSRFEMVDARLQNIERTLGQITTVTVTGGTHEP